MQPGLCVPIHWQYSKGSSMARGFPPLIVSDGRIQVDEDYVAPGAAKLGGLGMAMAWPWPTWTTDGSF